MPHIGLRHASLTELSLVSLVSLVLDVSARRDGSPAQSLDGRLTQDTPLGELEGTKVRLCAATSKLHT
jgi:hypothetical protein